MTAKTPAIVCRTERGCLHISFTDRAVANEERIQQIDDELCRLIDAEAAPRLVIDFSDVRAVSSMLLGTLIQVHNRTRSRNGQIRLVCLAPTIEKIIVESGLDRLFAMHTSAEQAFASFE